MSYFVLTSKKNKTILSTKKADMECHNFITTNTDVVIKFMDYTGRPKVIDKRNFIASFYNLTKDAIKTIELTERLISGSNNIKPLLYSLNLKEEYNQYKSLMKKNLL